MSSYVNENEWIWESIKMSGSYDISELEVLIVFL